MAIGNEGTHASVFSQTFAHGNSNNEIKNKQRKTKKRDLRREVLRARKKEVPTAIALPNQNTIIINIIIMALVLVSINIIF